MDAGRMLGQAGLGCISSFTYPTNMYGHDESVNK